MPKEGTSKVKTEASIKGARGLNHMSRRSVRQLPVGPLSQSSKLISQETQQQGASALVSCTKKLNARSPQIHRDRSISEKAENNKENQSQNPFLKEKRYVPSPYRHCTDQKLISSTQLSILGFEPYIS